MSTEELIKKASSVCKEHDEQLKYYCETCDELVCIYCTVKAHNGHQHDGEPLFVVVHHSGGDDWGVVHRRELLSLVRHDPH